MANVYVFNASSVSLMFSINNGTYTQVNGTSDTFEWIPFVPNTQPTFVNQLNPPLGVLGLGNNSLTMYPASSGSQYGATVQVSIPTDVSISSIQIYFVWKDARHLGVAVCNGGQFIQTISLQE